MSIIHVHNLTKTYTTYERGSTFLESLKSLFVRKAQTVHALKGISFDMRPGELVGFLGPNGAGKSTTLKILSGVLHPADGTVNVLGYTPWKDRRNYVANIGAVFGQKSQLILDIPPLDAFYLNKAIYRIPEGEFERRLHQMVTLLSVENVSRKPTRLLSLGERMKCEFIMAMLHNPPIVFLDEPTIGVDVIAKERIRKFILEMNRKGTTFILTTHDLEDIERLAQRVIVINHGEIVFDNSIAALRGYLGDRKIATVSTRRPLPDLDLHGLTVINRLSPYKAEVELDVSVLELNRFITLVNDESVIADLSLQEPPIENVIRELYLKPRPAQVRS